MVGIEGVGACVEAVSAVGVAVVDVAVVDV